MVKKHDDKAETITTEERLENGIRHQPDRYIAVRDKTTKKLFEVHDTDTGRLWIKQEKGWIWVE